MSSAAAFSKLIILQKSAGTTHTSIGTLNNRHLNSLTDNCRISKVVKCTLFINIKEFLHQISYFTPFSSNGKTGFC